MFKGFNRERGQYIAEFIMISESNIKNVIAEQENKKAELKVNQPVNKISLTLIIYIFLLLMIEDIINCL